MMSRSALLPLAQRRAIAMRLRALLGTDPDDNGLREVADRLGVSASDLRDTIDADEPVTLDRVLQHVVIWYGIDPCWLVTGSYDASTHRRAMAASDQALLALIRELLESPVTESISGVEPSSGAPRPWA